MHPKIPEEHTKSSEREKPQPFSREVENPKRYMVHRRTSKNDRPQSSQSLISIGPSLLLCCANHSTTPPRPILNWGFDILEACLPEKK